MGFLQVRDTPFPAPFPLETKGDAEDWLKRGFNGALSNAQWRRALGWSGYGAKEATNRIMNHWAKLSNGIRNPAPKGISFPNRTPEPSKDIPMEWQASIETALEEIKAEVKPDRMAEMEARIQALEAKVAALEFIP